MAADFQMQPAECGAGSLACRAGIRLGTFVFKRKPSRRISTLQTESPRHTVAASACHLCGVHKRCAGGAHFGEGRG